MPRSGKSKSGGRLEHVAPVAGQRPLGGAHSGSADLIGVLEKVLPFLFKKSHKKSEVRSESEKKTASHNSHLTSHSSKLKAHSPKTHAKKTAKKAVRSAVSAPVAMKPAKAPSKAGFILAPEENTTNAKDVEETLIAEAEDDAFLKKVAIPNAKELKPAKKKSGWGILTMRLFEKAPPKAEKPVETSIDPEELKDDSFLKRVEQKKVNAVVGTAVSEDDLPDAKEKASGLDDFATGSSKKIEERPRGHILSAADLQKETREAKQAALRVEQEVKEIKEEMRSFQKEREKAIDDIDEKKKKQPEAPVEVHIKAKPVKKTGGFQKFLAGLGHIGLGKERMRFVQNLATMLNAGLPLIDGLRTLQLETRAKPMRKILQKILDSVENGSALWRAMDDQSFFSLHAIALVRIGEEAGNLAQNMEYLALQEEKDHELKSKVKMAMIYPSIVMTIMFIIVIGLGMFVLPNLIGVLYSLNVPLPFVTRMVILFSNTFTNYGHIAVPAMIGGFFFMIILAKYTPLKVMFQWMMFRVPGVGSLAREATIARFGVILGGLLKAGVPVIEAMQSLVEVTPIVSYRKLYSRMLDHITIGDSFSKSFAAIKGSEKLLPPSVQQLVITGEKSGALADIMLKVADIYDKKASETAQKLPVILEPMLLLFIGGLVGTIAFAIIVPIYSIVGTVGR